VWWDAGQTVARRSNSHAHDSDHQGCKWMSNEGLSPVEVSGRVFAGCLHDSERLGGGLTQQRTMGEREGGL